MPCAATGVQLERLLLSEESQKEKGRHRMTSLTRRSYTIVPTNLSYKTETDSQTLRADLRLPSWRRGGGGRGWGYGISRCQLLYAGQINKKVPVYSTGN